MAATPHRSLPTPLRLLPQIRNPNGAPLRPSARLSALSRDSLPFPAPPPPSSASTRISPAVLFTVVILALIFFISGLLHLLVRSLIKKRPSSSAAASFSSSPYSTVRRRAANLRQLFRLHDSGLDQAFIDSLPLFLYREILGSKEPFDCAVCLCEFEPDDKLRLLPVCGHAFHLNCIDTWLLSNSTCPLCRGAIFAHGLTVENPIFNLNDSLEEEAEGDEAVCEKRVLFPVRLGKLKKVSVDDDDDDDNDCGGDVNGGLRGEVGETSSNNLDARRCFSMGYFQYVVSDSDLQVDLRGSTTSNDGKRLGIRRDESFSVSKIWQWSDKKGKFPMWSDAAALDGGLPWIRSSVEDI